jgi:hypothetical protein
MAITALPTAPNRSSDPATFSDDADTWVAALGTFTTEANALQAAVNAKESSATTAASTAEAQAGTATTKAEEAAASAASASLNSATQATSTTSLDLGAGTKVFTLAQTGKSLVVGQWVSICDTATPSARWMLGAVTAFTSGTGAITVEVTQSQGSGSGTAWTIAAAAPINNLKLAAPKFIPLRSAFNYLTYSNDFSNAGWIKTAITVSAVSTLSDPFGGVGAWLADDASASAGSIYMNKTVAVPVGSFVCTSIYVKRGTAAQFTLSNLITGGSNSTVSVECAWASDTEITFSQFVSSLNSGQNIEYNSEYIGGGWHRVWITVQPRGDGTAIRHQIYPAGSSSTNTGTTYIYGAQLEMGVTSPSLYVDTVATAQAGSGVIQQNLITYSEDLENAAWVKTNCTALNDQVRYGVVGLARIARTATGNDFFSQTVTMASTAYKTFTFSIVVVRGANSGNLILRLRDGAATEHGTLAIAPTIYPTRYSATITLPSSAAANLQFIIDPSNDAGAAGDTSFVGGIQLVQGFDALDYVKTTSAAVNASAEKMLVSNVYEMDTTNGAITVGMPDPEVGAEFSVVDVGGVAASNPITINANGSKIMGLNEPLIFNENFRSLTFKYTTVKGWVMR